MCVISTRIHNCASITIPKVSCWILHRFNLLHIMSILILKCFYYFALHFFLKCLFSNHEVMTALVYAIAVYPRYGVLIIKKIFGNVVNKK